MGQSLVIGLFGIWLLLSVLVYFPALRKVIRKLDWLALIPEWEFFAPIPGQQDYYVLYQDKYNDGTLTHWTEVKSAPQRGWWNMVWNPGRRGNKALFDLVHEFLKLVNSGDRTLEFSIPYLSLLNYISSIPRSTSPKFTQFLLMYSHGNSAEEDPEVLYISRLHEL